jgi:hypothetical protein
MRTSQSDVDYQTIDFVAGAIALGVCRNGPALPEVTWVCEDRLVIEPGCRPLGLPVGGQLHRLTSTI